MNAGVDPDFGLLEEAQSRILARQAAEAVLDDLLASRPEIMRPFLKELDTGSSDAAGALLSLYEEARSAGVPVEALRIPDPPPSDGWSAIAGDLKVLALFGAFWLTFGYLVFNWMERRARRTGAIGQY